MIVKSAVETYTGKIEVEEGNIEFTFRKPSILDIQAFHSSLIQGDVTAEELQTGKYKINVEKALKADLYLLALSILTINICAEWNKMPTEKRIEEIEELAKTSEPVYTEILRQIKDKVGGLL